MEPILQNCPVILHQTHKRHGKVLLTLILSYRESESASETNMGMERRIVKKDSESRINCDTVQSKGDVVIKVICHTFH